MNFGKYAADIQQCWQGMLIMCFVTLVISIIYIFLLKWITKPLLYTSMAVIFIGFFLLGVWAWMQRSKYDGESNKESRNYATAGAVVSWVLVALYACFVCCMWKNISLGASIMEAASDFVAGNLRVIIMPLVAYVFALVFLLFWIFTCTYIWTIGEP
jgi:hypothetical protein